MSTDDKCAACGREGDTLKACSACDLVKYCNRDCQIDSGEEITLDTKVNTSCEQNEVNNIAEGIDGLAILDDVSTCAACGKEGNSDDMNICNKCKVVKYCNAACKKKHRKKHKKACEKRVAELYDEKLFADPPPPDECPICMLPLPLAKEESKFKLCCGKVICNGCLYAMMMSEGGADLCPFCRDLVPITNQKVDELLKELMNKGNADGYHQYALSHEFGKHHPINIEKANEFYLKAGDLGCTSGYYNLGISYLDGNGVEVNNKKAKQYWELAAMGGDFSARFNVGVEEQDAGNWRLAFKHFMISAKAGYPVALEFVTDNCKTGVKRGFMTEEEYADTLRAYHESRKEVKSDDRDKARVAFGTRGL